MLGKKDEEVKISTLLGSSSEINGDFEVEGSARVDGKINGNVTVTGTLIVGASGSIVGNISAKSVRIGGEVLGDISAPAKAEFMESARVLGDVTTSVIVIDEHAVFQGGCNMNQDVPDKKARANNAKAVRAGKKSAKAAIAEALKEVEEEARKEERDAGQSAELQAAGSQEISRM